MCNDITEADLETLVEGAARADAAPCPGVSWRHPPGRQSWPMVP